MTKLQFVRPDTYFVVIAVIVALSFGTAWGLTWNDERNLHESQCDVAISWLEQSEDNIGLFERARTMQNIDPWLVAQDELNSPSVANELRWSMMDSARYLRDNEPLTATSSAGVLNISLYEGRLQRGAQDLIKHCPEVESMLPDAFPMVFTKEPTE